MSVPAAYLGIVLIWSTTPLAVKWSGDGPGFLFGVSGRMLLGAALCLLLVRVLGTPFPWHRDARRTYLIAGLGLYIAMIAVYWGAQFVPSGLISVLFGMSPLVVALPAALWLGERQFTLPKLAGMLAGVAGLAVIFHADVTSGQYALPGALAVLLSVIVHSLSAVWVKRIGAAVPALAVTTGALGVAAPLYVITWLALDGQWPHELPPRAALAILYLAVFGSALGFALYYYVLRKLKAGSLALITLITPVIALVLGHILNHEALGASLMSGTALILAGLALHQWGGRTHVTHKIPTET